MKKIPCLYAIVRFCPFVETEEFANVGVVMISPEHRVFEFKLMTKKHARITNFFEQLDAPIFKTAIQNLKEELTRIRGVLQRHGFDKRLAHNDVDLARALFQELVRPRESVIKFSNVRAVLLVDAKAKLEELYGHYVERDFVTVEYREQVLEKALRRWLVAAGVNGRFERLEVGNEEYHATFPFVEQYRGEVRTVIKPLNLGQEQPSKILDHGGAWIWKLNQLKRKNLLPPRVLFTVDSPKEDITLARHKAYSEVIDDLSLLGATVISHDQKDEILQFVS
jgi:hypothetical protein